VVGEGVGDWVAEGEGLGVRVLVDGIGDVNVSVGVRLKVGVWLGMPEVIVIVAVT